MTTTGEAIRKFDLQGDVDKFVKSKLSELVTGKHCFSFEGSNSPCGDRSPHIPHYRGSYDTVRYGTLGYYCLGAEGDGLHIEIDRSSRGSPETPARASGYWWLESEVVE